MKIEVKLFLMSLSLALLASSCDIQGPEMPSFPTGFTAMPENHSVSCTRTSLDAPRVLWSAGDTILVYKVSALAPGYNGHAFGLDPACDGKERGLFSDPGFEDYYPEFCYAVYPASAAESIDGSVITLNLPQEQTAAENSFGKDANLAVAVSKRD